MKTYLNREVTRETIALGTGGQIDRDGKPEMPPKSVVTIQAKATTDSIKHKFLDDGTIHEILTLSIDTATFEVLDVQQPVEPAQLKLGEESEPAASSGDPEGFDQDAWPAANPATAAQGFVTSATHQYVSAKGAAGPCKVCGAGPNTGVHDEGKGLTVPEGGK